MGQELAAARPFLFFCDFGPDLAEAVTSGRRREFARFARFADPESRAAIPDPNDPETFERCRLDVRQPDAAGKARLDLHRQLRAEHVVPRLSEAGTPTAVFETLGPAGIAVSWRLGDGSGLHLLANLGPVPVPAPMRPLPSGRPLWSSHSGPPPGPGEPIVPWAVHWILDASDEAS
jgi:1,4-alpha-glucan branching enzyme